MEEIEHPTLIHIPGIPDYLTMTWIVIILLACLSYFVSRNLKRIPTGWQNFMEMLIENLLSLIDEVVGPRGRKYLPLIGSLALFIMVSNLLGLVPGFIAPTGNLNTTAACALIVFFSYHFFGIMEQGILRYLKHFMGPVWWLAPLMIPIEVISHISRPLSLSVRLFGNMMGGHIVLTILFFLSFGLFNWSISGSFSHVISSMPVNLLSVTLNVMIMGLKIFVALVQTFIFIMLSMMYIAGAIAHEEEH